MRTSRLAKNICCIEGYWNEADFRDTSSIKGALQLLQDNDKVDYAYRRCATMPEVVKIITEFCKPSYKDFGIIYFASHGTKSCIRFDDTDVSLDDLAKYFSNQFTRKIIHFGSCSTIKVDKRNLNKFLCETGAAAVSGYKNDVDFLKSTVLDLLYFQLCQTSVEVSKIKNAMNSQYSSLARELGFRMECNEQFVG